MHHKAAYKLNTGNGNIFCGSGFIVFGFEGYTVTVNRYNACIGDSYTVGIASKIGNGITIAVKCFPDFGIPVNLIESVAVIIPVIGVSEFFV